MKKSTKSLLIFAAAAAVGIYFYKKHQKSIAKEKAMKAATDEFEEDETDEYSNVVSGKGAKIFPSKWLNASFYNDATGGEYAAGGHYRGDMWPDKWAHKGAVRQSFFNNAIVEPCPQAGGECTYQSGGRSYAGYIDGATCRCVPKNKRIVVSGSIL